jgi:orotidine-5'-phosphate decarboxylase
VFLVPGFGAQGGTAADVRPAFRGDGLGAVVNSSRGLMFPSRAGDEPWERSVERAVKETITALAGKR